MQTGLSLQALAAKITQQAGQKVDFVADTSKLTMQVQRIKDEATEGAARHQMVLEADNHGSFPILPIAHDQIGARLGIPGKYYDRMLADAPDLLATNVNAWFRLKPERRMVRTLAGSNRAFLSNRYQRIENDQIARTVLPILADIPGVRVVSSEITDRRLYIQAVTPRELVVKRGDAVQAGVIISNSEVGHGSVSVRPLIFRLVCLNGMVREDGRFRANHVGRRIEEGELESINYADDTRQADDHAVLLKVRDHVSAAIDEAMFAQAVEKMTGLTESGEAKNLPKAIEVLTQKLSLSETEGNDILTSLAQGGDLTAWGVLNAVTAQAHSKAISYDRAVEFETLGGKLLELPRKEWTEILEAA